MCNGIHDSFYGGSQNFIRRTLNPETGARSISVGYRDGSGEVGRRICDYDSNGTIDDIYGYRRTPDGREARYPIGPQGHCRHQGPHGPRGPHGPQDIFNRFNRPGFGGPRNLFDSLWQGIGNLMGGYGPMQMRPMNPHYMAPMMPMMPPHRLPYSDMFSGVNFRGPHGGFHGGPHGGHGRHYEPRMSKGDMALTAISVGLSTYTQMKMYN